MSLSDDGERSDMCQTTSGASSSLLHLSPPLFLHLLCGMSEGSPRRAPAPVPGRSTFLRSNRNSYISSRPTPTETSHLGADLAGCAQPSDLPPSLSLSSRAACCSPSNHNHTLPCASRSSLGIALPSLFFPPSFIPFLTEGIQVNVSSHFLFQAVPSCPSPSLRLPPPSTTCSLMQNTTEGFDLGQPPNHSINIVPERGSVTSLRGFSGECVGIKRRKVFSSSNSKLE